MTTWTPKTQQVETWTAKTPVRGVFSQLIFSPDSFGGKHVFALGNPAGGEGWYRKSIVTKTWAVEAAP